MKTNPFLITLLMMMHGGLAFAQTNGNQKETPESENDSISGGYYDLDDIVITADKPIVKSDGANITYNVKEDPSAKGNTLLDALRKVPMVTVDGENNIRINGQSNFKIYVNGKEDQSLSANYKDVFRAMPAEAVSAIEVLTEPGAKYDAEGTGGIINLVTITKSSSDGYSGTLTASFSKASPGGSAYARMKRKRLSLSANIDYANGSLFPQKNDNNMTIENLRSEDARFQQTLMHQIVKFNYMGGGLNLAYDISDNDIFSANGNIFSVRGNLDDCMTSTSTFNAAHSVTSFLKRGADAQLTNTGLTAGASWQHDFNKKGHNTVLSYQYNHGFNRLWIDFALMEQSGLSDADPFEHQETKEYNNEHTIQFDYANSLGPNHSVEAGAKGIFRRNNALSATAYGSTPGNLTDDPSQITDMTQKQDIYAAYASYNGTFGNLAANAGVRYEHTNMGIDFHYGQETDFSNHMNDIVPNASLTYSFSPASNIRLSYQMRIARPSLSQVNPFRRCVFPNIVETGNPDLESEKGNKLTLSYTNFGTVAGGNIGIEYSATDNAISQYMYTSDGVTYKTYANIGHNRRLALFGFLNWTVIPRMQFSINGRLTREMYSTDSPRRSNAGWNLNYTANWNYTLPVGITMNAYGGHSTRSYSLQGFSDGWYYYGVGVSKGFLKDDALTISLNANNFMQSHIKYRNVTTTEDVRTSSVFTNRNWNVGVSLSWKFGNLKGNDRKTGSKIVNDDKSSVGNDNRNGL